MEPQISPEKNKWRGEPDDMDEDDHKARRCGNDDIMSVPGSLENCPTPVWCNTAVGGDEWAFIHEWL